MWASVAKAALLVVAGVVLGALIPDGLGSAFTSRCADLYAGIYSCTSRAGKSRCHSKFSSQPTIPFAGRHPVVYSIEQLWQHATTHDPGLAHLTIAGEHCRAIRCSHNAAFNVLAEIAITTMPSFRKRIFGMWRVSTVGSIQRPADKARAARLTSTAGIARC